MYGLAFSPEGNEIATASGDHWVRVWDTEVGRAAPSFLPQLPSSPAPLLLMPSPLSLWQTGQLRRRMCGSGAAYAVSWSKEANKVAACFSTGTAAVFDG